MTIAFPRTMPSVGALGSSFELERVDFLSPEAGGRLGAVTAGFPLWRLSLGLQNMLAADADVWRAWVLAQRGAQRQFYGRDLDRPVPRFHAGGRPYTRTTEAWAQAIDGEGNAVLTLENMQAGMVLSFGDYVGFVWDDTKRSLVRVVEGGLAGADGSLTVTVEPPVPTVTPADATANLNRPTCLMRLVTPETRLGEQMPGGYTSAGGQIVAVQDLRA